MGMETKWIIATCATTKPGTMYNLNLADADFLEKEEAEKRFLELLDRAAPGDHVFLLEVVEVGHVYKTVERSKP